MTPYAELQALSNFSFLRGASHPEELALTASVLGLQGLALADVDSMAGVVRGHLAAKQYDLTYMPATRLNLRDAPSVICLPLDRAAWGRCFWPSSQWCLIRT